MDLNLVFVEQFSRINIEIMLEIVEINLCQNCIKPIIEMVIIASDRKRSSRKRVTQIIS